MVRKKENPRSSGIFPTYENQALSLVFTCRENPRRSGILLFPDCPRFCRLMKTRNRRYPRSSGSDGDKSGESGAFLFSRRVSDFCDGRRSFPTNENSNLYRRGRRRWISLINNPLNFWAPVSLSYICVHQFLSHFSISRQIQCRKNLGQTPGDYPIYPQNLGRSAKSKIPNRLGFSRHPPGLSGEGNAGERWKTTIGLMSKKATLSVQHTFFVHFFALVLHDYNVKLPETS